MRGDFGKIGDRKADVRVQTPRGPSRLRVKLTKKKLAVALTVLASFGMMAIVLLPAGESTATPGRTGGNCTSCHPSTTTAFLTVTGLPVLNYNPGQAYAVTISIADTNGATGQNSFDFTVSAGTITSTDPNVSVITGSKEAVASVYTVSSWTLTWTAPTSGQVTIDVWAVFGGGSKSTSFVDRQTYVLNSVAIPEFTTLILPVAGILALIIVAAKATRARK